MIPAERKALLFLAAVGVLGVGARVATGRFGDAATSATTEQTMALDAQLAAVDSARARTRAPKAPKAARRRAGGRQRDDPGHPGRDLPRARASVSGGPSEGPIDVDVADAASLEALPGIGPALARRIVDDRAQQGAFGSLEALGHVRGVGPRLLARLSPHVTFSGTPRPPALHGRRPALPRR
ncbi:MAG: ComEA family DNA-binding protein [Gemmatirosa sp.]